ncbi:hypothetical protein C8F04DRAFT_1319944 [Mycena alexandri]|uniref:Uncharacterized protein n=1 Tax=Mycena alexandri TaxID=1745969 RepID=A0AAD6T4A5_9AGAR|nr:hypothetical protein C8F04DRAFT_1319944 [Mycena alexandri]
MRTIAGRSGRWPFPATAKRLPQSQRAQAPPLSSLVLSFGILHEVTAVVPLVGFFYTAKAFGVGETLVKTLQVPTEQDTWLAQKYRTWLDDGQHWAARVGRRYGVFGYEKGGREDQLAPLNTDRIAGDVANAVAAYACTKAALPARILVSLSLSPAFARTVIDPTRRGVRRIFRKGP